ncbi:IDEAL domain-containing protein [Priestia aryabhattai]|uniref:IDEAL domain-containing protein n=1 Tax=Priestia aryabhattai TaxID=412384 RepID=UPI0015F4FB1B|nr:IDEAL domain-containing protein [Priestia aryabhattai]
MSEWSDFYRKMEEDTKMKSPDKIEETLNETEKEINQLFKDFDVWMSGIRNDKTRMDIFYRGESGKTIFEDWDVKLSNSDRLSLIDRYIDMALETKDEVWFMELTNQKNELLKQLGGTK